MILPDLWTVLAWWREVAVGLAEYAYITATECSDLTDAAARADVADALSEHVPRGALDLPPLVDSLLAGVTTSE